MYRLGSVQIDDNMAHVVPDAREARTMPSLVRANNSVRSLFSGPNTTPTLIGVCANSYYVCIESQHLRRGWTKGGSFAVMAIGENCESPTLFAISLKSHNANVDSAGAPQFTIYDLPVRNLHLRPIGEEPPTGDGEAAGKPISVSVVTVEKRRSYSNPSNILSKWLITITLHFLCTVAIREPRL